MKTEKKYNWMYKSMIANIPVTGVEYLRPKFTKWFKQFCRLIEK